MFAVAKEEFRNLAINIKMILLVILIALFNYNISNMLTSQLSIDGIPKAYAGLRIIFFILGYLLISIFSHSVLNKEIADGTLKFILSKVSREEFIVGKFLGIFLFWTMCMLINISMLSILGVTFSFYILWMLCSAVSYFISIVMLLSVLIKKENFSNFMGLFVGILFPTIGLYVTESSNMLVKYFQYIFPYFYLLKGGIYITIPYILSFILLLFVVIIFNKKEV